VSVTASGWLKNANVQKLIQMSDRLNKLQARFAAE
jgi:hypothetical protein